MGVPALEVGYTSATTVRGDHEVHKRHVVALEKNSGLVLWLPINNNGSERKHMISEYICPFLGMGQTEKIPLLAT
jgi:hypothetical protein